MTIITALTRGAEALGKVANQLADVVVRGLEQSNGSSPAMQVVVECDRCGEKIAGRVDRANDLLPEYGPDDGDDSSDYAPVGYVLHKEFLGRNCQNIVRVTMKFDDHRKVIDHEVEGGTLVEYADNK